MPKIEKRDWIRFFPLKTPRPEQEEGINFVLNSFESKYKYCIGEFPIGIGKSAIAITISNYYKNKIHNGNKSSYIVTTQKVLQEQYIRDFPNVSSITAKQNYQCLHRAPGITCDIGLTLAKILSTNTNSYAQYVNSCAYKVAKSLFDDSDMSLTNMSFFLYHADSDIKKRNVLIIDECHNIENSVTDFASMTLTKYFTEETLKIKWPKVEHISIESFMDWVINVYSPKLSNEFSKLESVLLVKKSQSYLESQNGLKMMGKIEEYKRKIEQLGDGIKNFDKRDWVMTVSATQDLVNIKPIFANKYTNKLLFKMADKILLMSGTILNKDTFCNNIGINPEEATFLSLDSPFAVKNRPIYEMPIGSMGKKNIDDTLPSMVSAIKIILDEHKDDKGLIHCHTYKIAKYIADNIDDNRLLFHSSDDRIDILNFHLYSKEPTVIVSPSFTEGIDLIGDKSRFQIIVKVPFPYLGDNYVKTKMERVSNWYNWQTLKTIIQSSGRSIRDYDDYASTYILDSDWLFIKSKNLNMIPKWFKNAIQK